MPLAEVDRHDLCALTPNVADITGIKLAYERRPALLPLAEQAADVSARKSRLPAEKRGKWRSQKALVHPKWCGPEGFLSVQIQPDPTVQK